MFREYVVGCLERPYGQNIRTLIMLLALISFEPATQPLPCFHMLHVLSLPNEAPGQTPGGLDKDFAQRTR
jgi:hypothetical protein